VKIAGSIVPSCAGEEYVARRVVQIAILKGSVQGVLLGIASAVVVRQLAKLSASDGG
jgi:hypothetical protein